MAGKREILLIDERWGMVKPFIPQIPTTMQGERPRPDIRAYFEGILWVLSSGTREKGFPGWYPSPSTFWRRLAEWDEIFRDGRFTPARKRAMTRAVPYVKTVQRGWWWEMDK